MDEGETVTFRCSVPGVDDAVIHWRREDGSPLGYGVTDEDGVLTIPRAEPSDAGTYVCWNDDPHGGAPIESQPAYLTVNPAPRMFHSFILANITNTTGFLHKFFLRWQISKFLLISASHKISKINAFLT